MSLSSNRSDAIVDRTQNRWQFTGFYILAILFNLCLGVQLLTVGLALFQSADWWQTHLWFARKYSVLSLILVGWSYWVVFPRRVRILSASLPIFLGLQFLTVRLQTPLPLAVVHPLIGFALFSTSTTLVHRVGQIVRNPERLG
ncbi:MAG: DUF6220 domain-containing protein [Cyanobacteriota bacterium]|nr:DUF6220 domain-containing protein [Cyanobacteriota bacterium]